MAFKDFSDTQYIKTVDTGEEIRIGSFFPPKNLELAYMRATIFISGAVPTNEEMRINVYSDDAYSSKLFSSEWSKLSDIEGVTSYWIGWLRVTLDRQPLNKFIKYYHTIEFRNYTRTPTYFLGAAYDFPFPIYDNGETYFYNHSLQFQLFGYVKRSEQ
jgi:hypothetical protein